MENTELTNNFLSKGLLEAFGIFYGGGQIPSIAVLHYNEKIVLRVLGNSSSQLDADG